ncbi:PREDICTED: uncharacterized protein At2g27730, mitochondrial-like isoform X2 [Populus euphratica]|uniref:Uncharacterized protein At2g27730, mitochondrial-like isoform X2 n=1 Tax=Populus euphratica TaxID=75702 RepID=A0AAJ6X5V4_POPEU|nr:PREDICTED: uncharacterized protein At2g27730, mitochondrial-like isoform X2 [Populus euphratica]
MATLTVSAARRLAFRRFSSGGKVLSEEEKAAENVYIKKAEKEKLEKLARKEETTASGSGGASTDIKASTAASPTPPGVSTEKVSTDKYRNYAVVAGTVTVFGALGWYLKSGGKKQGEVRD